jgi:hypothetical protein
MTDPLNDDTLALDLIEVHEDLEAEANRVEGVS